VHLTHFISLNALNPNTTEHQFVKHTLFEDAYQLILGGWHCQRQPCWQELKTYQARRKVGSCKSTSMAAEIPVRPKAKAPNSCLLILPKPNVSHTSLKAYISTAVDKRSCKPEKTRCHLAQGPASGILRAGWQQDLLLKRLSSCLH